jgi:hypothetical protein
MVQQLATMRINLIQPSRRPAKLLPAPQPRPSVVESAQLHQLIPLQSAPLSPRAPWSPPTLVSPAWLNPPSLDLLPPMGIVHLLALSIHTSPPSIARTNPPLSFLPTSLTIIKLTQHLNLRRETGSLVSRMIRLILNYESNIDPFRRVHLMR